MAYTLIPVQPQANQSFSCILDGQSAQIALETTDYGLFATVAYNGEPVATSRLCLDRTNINSAEYNGLPQALFFADIQGQSDPVYTGFGTQYLLCYGDPPMAQTTGANFSFGMTGTLDFTFTLNESVLA